MYIHIYIYIDMYICIYTTRVDTSAYTYIYNIHLDSLPVSLRPWHGCRHATTKRFLRRDVLLVVGVGRFPRVVVLPHLRAGHVLRRVVVHGARRPPAQRTQC